MGWPLADRPQFLELGDIIEWTVKPTDGRSEFKQQGRVVGFFGPERYKGRNTHAPHGGVEVISRWGLLSRSEESMGVESDCNTYHWIIGDFCSEKGPLGGIRILKGNQIWEWLRPK